MIKPTGKPGLIRDRIFCCITIERRIMEKANAAILGVDSAESGHSGDDGDSASSDVMEDGAEAADGGVAFQFSGEYEEGGEEDEEVAAATNAGVAEEEQGVSAAIDPGVNEAARAHSAEASEMACCPPSLPAFVSGGLSNVGQGSAVSSLASRPPSLSAFISGGLPNVGGQCSAVSSSASRGGQGHRNVVQTPRKSPTLSLSFNSGVVGGGGGKTKNSTNR
jgi:hypothetical protein